jgi:hypothetical protein
MYHVGLAFVRNLYYRSLVDVRRLREESWARQFVAEEAT